MRRGEGEEDEFGESFEVGKRGRERLRRVSLEQLSQAVCTRQSGVGRDFGGRVESWRGEGGEAAHDQAVVKACPQKNEGGWGGAQRGRFAIDG